MRYSLIKSRLMPALLAVVLLLSLIPAGAYADAAGTGTVIQPEKVPDQPVTEGCIVTPVIGSNGHAAALVPEKSVADTITKALNNAKVLGKSANGIGVLLNVDLPNTANALEIVLTQAVLKNLVNAGIKKLEVNGSILTINLDLEAVKEIQKQSIGDLTITISHAQNLSSADKALIGTRPAYNITFSYVNNGKTVNITNLGRGTAVVSFPNIQGEKAAPFIPGGYDGQHSDAAAPFIPGGLGGQ